MNKVKDIVTVIREAIIIAILILLLVSPSWINKRLVDAGFTKGSIAGLEWEAKVEESQKSLENANAEVTELKAELGAMSSAINSISHQALPPAAQTEVRQLQIKVDSSRTNLEGVDRSLKRSLNEHEYILKEIKSRKE